MSDLSLACALDRAATLDPVATEEAHWVDEARAGNLEAFDAIMSRYELRLQRFLIGLVRDVELAHDLCQDTFLSAYKALPRTSGELRISAWLHTIALNSARSHYRRKGVRLSVPLEEDDRYVHPGPDLQETVATHDSVHAALALIPKQYAEVLLLQMSGDLSCREIGRVVGCSEGAVKVRLLRARNAFRKAYVGDGMPA